jgi:hypothetical protein
MNALEELEERLTALEKNSGIERRLKSDLQQELSRIPLERYIL